MPPEAARPISILHIITKLAVGGAQMNTLISCRDISALGYPSSILAGPEISPEGSFLNLANSYSIPVYFAGHLKRRISPWSDFLAFLEIRRIIRNGGFSIIHTHGSKAKFLGRLAAASCGGVKVVQTVHGWSFFESMSVLRKYFYVMLEKIGHGIADSSIVVSPHDIRKGTDKGIGKPGDYVVIRSGVEFDAFKAARGRSSEARELMGVPENVPVIGSVMRIAEQKAPLFFVNVAARVLKSMPDAHFVIVGDGPQRPLTEEHIDKYGLHDSFHLLGNRTDVPDLLPGFDVFLITSRSEGLPRAMLEALAARIPVVATDVGGISELVDGTRNGILCREGDQEGLARGVLRILGDPGLAESLLESVDQDLEPFSASIMTDQLFDLYTRLSEEGG
jgi:glycosyltransferase involved in cell wall biosynthesis